VVALAIVVNTVCIATGWPAATTGNPAVDGYFVFAVAGSVCLMVCYLMVEIATVWFVGAPRFLPVHGGTGRTAGLVLPTAGAVVILVVLWFSVKDSTGWFAAPILGIYWCAIGSLVAVSASPIAKRVGAALSAELELPAQLR
jgi:hypothetical protein